jgi:hypothetical protein
LPDVETGCHLRLFVVSFVMRLHGFFVMVLRVEIVGMRQLSMVRGFFVMTLMRVLCRFSVMFGCVLVVLGCLGMMAVSFLLHRVSP